MDQEKYINLTKNNDFKFSKEFIDKYQTSALISNIINSLVHNDNPYPIIENLVDMVEKYQTELQGYIEGSKPAPIYVPFDSLPDDLKEKIINTK